MPSQSPRFQSSVLPKSISPSGSSVVGIALMGAMLRTPRRRACDVSPTKSKTRVCAISCAIAHEIAQTEGWGGPVTCSGGERLDELDVAGLLVRREVRAA